MILRYFINIILFGAALLATNAFLDARIPHVFPDAIQQKFDYFKAHKDEYDVVFVGSSLIYRQVIPEVFDRRMAEAGRPMRSFNLATYGMRFQEMDQLVREMLALDSESAKWIFLDGTAYGTFGLFVPEANWYTDRLLWYHTPSQTASVIAGVLREDAPFAERWEQARMRWTHGCMRTLHIGQGRTYYDIWQSRRSADAEPPPVRDEGFRSLDQSYRDGSQGTIKRRDEFLAVEDWYRNKLETFRNGTMPDRDATAIAPRRAAYTRQVNAIRNAGAEPIYLLAPAMKWSQAEYQLAEEGAIPHLFAYNDPNKYPHFYEFSARFDENHLTEDAARRYTQTIADDFIRLLNESN